MATRKTGPKPEEEKAKKVTAEAAKTEDSAAAAAAGPGTVPPEGGEPEAGSAPTADGPPVTDPGSAAADEAKAAIEPEHEGPCGSSLGKGKRVCAEFMHSLSGESFLTALSFLSRLGPARILDEAQLRRSVIYFPLVGVIIAVIAAIPAWVLPSGQLWIKAWLFSLLTLWLSRGLHWDGLADLSDALGSNKSGAEFQSVLKDSRSGVFAILAVVFGALGYVIAVHGLLVKGDYLPLILAPAFARCAPLLIGNLSKPNENSTLGLHLHEAVGLKTGLVWVAALAVIGILWGYFLGVLLSLIVAAAVLYALLNLAERHAGYNGDFLGASIVLVEVCALLMFALA